MAIAQSVNPDVNFISEVKRLGGAKLKQCYQCATCSVTCNLSPDESPFPRKEMLLAQWGQKEELVKDADIWLCFQCNDCTTRCPRGARPGDVLAAIRSYIYEHYAFPRFMGKALSSPKALPVLLIVPILILLGCIMAFAPTGPDGTFLFQQGGVIDFNLFLPHSSVDALFVIGNIIIFIFAAIGFVRFWRNLGGGDEPKQRSFLGSLVITLKEIAVHSSFFKCEANRARSWGHILMLGGFVAAMITTGAIFVFVFIPHYLELLGLQQIESFFALPVDLPNPVKFIGMFGGLGLMIGGGLLIIRRWNNKDQVGANGYADYLFLYIIFLAGFTGMLSWLTRLTGVAMVAYISYFIHLVIVFFLLWYMPYSKFAHMIYRTLALVHSRMIGRQAKAA